MPTDPNMKLFMDPFYITLLLSSPLLATLLPPLLLLIVPTKRMCFCVGKVLDKRVIALLSRNGQKMFPAQIVLLFQTSDFYTLSDRKDPPFLPAASGNTGLWSFQQMDRKLERYLGKNRPQSNEVIEFREQEQ